MCKICLVCLIVFTAMFTSSFFLAIAKGQTAKPQQSAERLADSDMARIKLERERLEFDKFNENRKAQYQIIATVLTIASILIPMLLGIYAVRSQVSSAYELKRIESENDFALKSAEIVMSARNPFGVRKKAEVLLDLFKGRLPENFVASFDPGKHVHVGPSDESKLVLLKLIVSNMEKEQEILRLWGRMFPLDPLQELFPGDYPKSTIANEQ